MVKYIIIIIIIISFSGFSAVNEEIVIWYQLEVGKKLADVLTECSSHHQGEGEEV